MSRRAIANAERQIATVTRGGSKAGTVEMAVYVPQRRGPKTKYSSYFLFPRGVDPLTHAADGVACSVRESRAIRQAKRNFGSVLFKLQINKDGTVAQAERVSMTQELSSNRLYRSPNDIVGDWAPKSSSKDGITKDAPRKRRGPVDWGEKNAAGETLGEVLVDIIRRGL